MGRTASSVNQPSRDSAERGRAEPKEGHRETVEAIVVALILALLVRGFEAEAFVIPTGSMAPTLMGRHKEITCPQCGYVYAVNASEEVEGSVLARNRRVYVGHLRQLPLPGPESTTSPSFKGDRILVMKFPYDLPFLPGLRPPERWDVVVFRYPEEPEVSYIKRLVGLPGETLRIYHGDVYHQAAGRQDAFQLARKPLNHQRAMQMIVYDDRSSRRGAGRRPEWRRWSRQRRRLAGRRPGDAEPRIAAEARAGRRLGRAAVSAPRPRPRAVGRDQSTIATCPAAPRPR